MVCGSQRPDCEYSYVIGNIGESSIHVIPLHSPSQRTGGLEGAGVFHKVKSPSRNLERRGFLGGENRTFDDFEFEFCFFCHIYANCG